VPHKNDAVLGIVVDCLRRGLLRRVVSKVFPLARRLPFHAALVPADTLEMRGGGGAASVPYGINAVRDVVVVRPRRSLLRGMVSKVYPLARCLPFPTVFAPADTRELRGGGLRKRNNAVRGEVAVRPRRTLLRDVVSQL